MSPHKEQATPTCPINTRADTIENVLEEYKKGNIHEFARQASIQEFECYREMADGRTPLIPRVEEVIQFARKMGYNRLGVAFCGGLRNEAEIFNSILENRGFEVTSVCCKVGGIAKETIGIKEEQKIAGPGKWETMCNPIAQAEILNRAGTDFNIMVGLCVGHDSLFLRYVKALTTVLIVKDRVFGHNPAAALYQSKSYYRKLMRKE
jgi:uncharacterized metal-binding protein